MEVGRPGGLGGAEFEIRFAAVKKQRGNSKFTFAAALLC